MRGITTRKHGRAIKGAYSLYKCSPTAYIQGVGWVSCGLADSNIPYTLPGGEGLKACISLFTLYFLMLLSPSLKIPLK